MDEVVELVLEDDATPIKNKVLWLAANLPSSLDGLRLLMKSYGCFITFLVLPHQNLGMPLSHRKCAGILTFHELPKIARLCVMIFRMFRGTSDMMLSSFYAQPQWPLGDITQNIPFLLGKHRETMTLRAPPFAARVACYSRAAASKRNRHQSGTFLSLRDVESTARENTHQPGPTMMGYQDIPGPPMMRILISA